ncbi:MAG TPA: hypothetical protein VFR93_10915, partial [Candidatus Limnocylindrales bacterium]|nr:hypothetical protein [Candidatus Limnocylindrales bacterium]
MARERVADIVATAPGRDMPPIVWGQRHRRYRRRVVRDGQRLTGGRALTDHRRVDRLGSLMAMPGRLRSRQV